MTYQNPATLFLEQQDVESLDDIVAYTDFLRHQSGQTSDPSIDLRLIYDHFGIPLPQQTQLPNQQGLTIFNDSIPRIIVNQADKDTRQRFTEAHELIELLFHELPGNFRIDRLKENVFGTKKERICQLGAANLLMPIDSFFPKALKMDISFQAAEQLACEYEVSLIATLFRFADIFPNRAAIVLWRMKNKPSELKKEIPEQQMQFPGFIVNTLPPQKLRVEWSYGEYQRIFIPNDKSANDDSSVYAAWDNNQFTSADEISPFSKYNRRIGIENRPITIKDEKHILSLIKRPHKV